MEIDAMTAAQINKLVRQTLISNGFKNTIPSREAAKIIRQTLGQLNITTHKVTVEQSPIHGPGADINCDCLRSKIKVEPLKRPKK